MMPENTTSVPDDERTGPEGSERLSQPPQQPRKAYEKPAILYSAPLESMANACDGGKTSSFPQELTCQSWLNS